MSERCLSDRLVLREGGHVGYSPCVKRRKHWLWHRDASGYRWWRRG